MRNYRVTDHEGNTSLVAHATIENAARRFVQQRHGQKTIARRVTGEPGLSGMFQAYEPLFTDRPGRLGEPAVTSIGNPFHIKED